MNKPLQKSEFEMHHQKYEVTKKQISESIKKRRVDEKKELQDHFKQLKWDPHLDKN